MPKWISLFRGVNVGGKNLMPMAQLVTLLESLQCSAVRTYIQSGNVVFNSLVKSRAKLRETIQDATESSFGFRPNVLLLTQAEFDSAIKNNPFPKAASEPKSLHFYFLEKTPVKPDLEGIEKLAAKNDQYRLIGDVFYLHAPEGIATSKVAAAVEKKLGVSATARNYNTIEALSKMLSAS